MSRVGKSVSSGGRWLPTQNVDHADIEFGSPIDRGAYGEVFRGVWQGTDVAIKVFSAGLLTSEGVASFQREVFVMNCLRHPNVVLLLGACQTPPKLSIIMEYVAGGSLHKASIGIVSAVLYNEKCIHLVYEACSRSDGERESDAEFCSNFLSIL